MLRYRQQTRRDHVVSLLPPISLANNEPMTVEERIFSDTPPPMTYTGSFPSKVLRHLDKSTFYSTPTKGEEALANKVMHDDIRENTNNEVTNSNPTTDKGHHSNEANNKVKESPNKKNNKQLATKNAPKTTTNNSQISMSVERRCSSAPGTKEEETYNHLTEVGNLTAPSTPRPTLSRGHSNYTLKDTNKVGIQQSGNEVQLELHGDSLELHSTANGRETPSAKQQLPPPPHPHYQQQSHQHHNNQQQQVQSPKMRPAMRDSSISPVKQQKPEFEIRAVGFSLSHRGKRETRNQTGTKSTDNSYGLKKDLENRGARVEDNAGPINVIPESVEVDESTRGQSEIKVIIPVIENEGSNDTKPHITDTSKTTPLQDQNNNDSCKPVEIMTETKTNTVDNKKTPVSISTNDQKVDKKEEITTKKERKTTHKKGRKNSKQHARKK